MPAGVTTTQGPGDAETRRRRVHAPLQQRSERNHSRDRDQPRSRSEDHIAAQDDTPLRCANCRAPVTSRSQAISVNSSHEHAFFNPSGIAFELRCFRRAPGCRVLGHPTSEFTWFAGYTWQLAICATCRSHLGWFFAALDDSFFALITGRIQ